MEDLKLIKDYCCKNFYDKDFAKVQEKYFALYQSTGGTVWGGKYTK